MTAATALPSNMTQIDPEKAQVASTPPAIAQPARSMDEKADLDKTYPKGMKLTLIMASLYLAVFLVALDRTIIATAIPQITNEFHSLTDIGWYASSYMMTSCAFQLWFGKLYVYYSTKYVFLLAIALFEIGSAICGAAPNSVAFIWGRSIAGFGSAGIFNGSIVIIVHTIPLAKRPMFQGLFGAVFGIASVVGPLIGGAFTTHVTWRWGFYINLPIGGVAVAAIIFLLHIPTPPDFGKPLSVQIRQIDPIGTAFFLPGIVCLLLALQWGGATYAWSNYRIILLLTLAGILLIGFVIIQVWKGDEATVPPRIIRNRSVAAGFYWSLCSGASMMIVVYFLATWFQAIEGVSAYTSGIRLLPLVLSLVAGSILGGAITGNVGYYAVPLILGTVLMSVGMGLLTTFEVNTSQAKWIGYQFVYGFGLGLGMQAPSMAVQTVLDKQDIPIGASLMLFAQWLGGAIFVSVGQNVLSNKLVEGLRVLPEFDIRWVTQSGATDLRNAIPAKALDIVLHVYNGALTRTFDIALAMSCAAMLGALAMDWNNIKKQTEK
ncbi:unnamed protein product [Periconia digitata]|uniref:Major facilitator superfamily (MFS) profile domain-containing protein n=1 Tax=Periconia digitata TaxID=1303443 RepID=A0A9W4USI0_9PLEO|nr:unnamed protein product [Periconia digitata]